jgi:hypothetical protein
MFIFFDSSNQLLDRLIKTKKTPPTSNQRNFRLRPNSFKHIGRRSITALPMGMEKRIDDRYPTYGMDIPDSCKIIRNHLQLIVENCSLGLPSNYDHVIFGELPPVTHDLKYAGRRLFIKPERFGFERTKISSALNDINSFVIQLVKQQYCRLAKGETKSECAKLQAFKENIDKDIYKKWKKILLKLPSKWKIDQRYKERAIKYGIREIDRQSKDLEAAGAGRDIKKFRKLLIEKYGPEDIRVRKGREIILTIDELRPDYSTCETNIETRCVF